MRHPSALRIAVVGCGAIARAFYLPALVQRRSGNPELILIDRSVEQGKTLARDFGVAWTSQDYREVIGRVDGAIVATPAETHATIASDFLSAGVPVLCEKPLAPTRQQAAAVIEQARRSGTPLGVNQPRRLYPGLMKARDLCRSGALGELRRIEIYEGAPFGWPLATNTIFGRGGNGRGVLADIGAHTLDTVCWWLGDRPTILRYRDDSVGGAEAEARVEFEFRGCTGLVHLSWLSRLSNEFLIEGTAGWVRGAISAWDYITRGTSSGRKARRLPLRATVANPLAVRDHVVDNLLQVVRGRSRPFVPGDQVLDSLAMIDECYRRREGFVEPWMEWREAKHVRG